jgi:hypothetical protein
MFNLPGRFILLWLSVIMAFALFAVAWPRRARAFDRCVTGCLMGLHRRPWLIALPVVASGLVVLWTHGFPQPRFHDEFSYLLAADTYAHGRLANPPHPLWESFETFHVNQQPFYVSMYPPGAGLVLAAGQRLLGHPWFAVWLSAIGLPLVVHWAARAWVSPPWAAAAGLVAAGIVSRGYWLDSYWGGALPAIAGGLVVGAWPRIRRVADNDVASMIGATLPLAGGGLLLLFTRPYEGLALVLPVATGLAMSRIGPRSHAAWISTCVVALVVGLAGLAFSNWKTTGSPLATPYVMNMTAYHHRKIFVLGADRDPPPVYRHDVMRRLYSEEYALRPFSFGAIRRYTLPTISFYGAPVHLFTIAVLPWLFRSRRTRPLLLATSCVCIAVLLTVFIRPHYLAPAAAGIVILAMQAFRMVATLRWRGRRVGRTVAYGFLVCWLAVAWGYGVARQMQTSDVPQWVRERTRIAEELVRMDGRHLVFVRYASGHSPHDEWVYNGADQGSDAKVLWARAIDEQSDARLIRHEAGRTTWLIEPDTTFDLRRLTP